MCLNNFIDWSKVDPEYKYAAMDMDGDICVFIHEPELGDTEWLPANDECDCEYVTTVYPNIDPDFPADWTQTLTRRPE